LVQAPIFAKTRFLIVVWVTFYCAADVALAWFRRRSSIAWGTAAWIATQALILAGFLDAARLLRR
jgi:hypothetical protein